jgi:hypothetical protein
VERHNLRRSHWGSGALCALPGVRLGGVGQRPVGAWTLISPWVLGFSGLFAAMLNAVIVGAAVLLLAIWTLGTDKDIGGWWSPAH